MAVRKIKPPKHSPTFEQANIERLKRASATVDLAKRTIEKSKRLAEEADEIISKLRQRKVG
jgi:hypothetical protein